MPKTIVSIFAEMTKPLASGVESAQALLTFYNRVDANDKDVSAAREQLKSIKRLLTDTQKRIKTESFKLDELELLQEFLDLVSECRIGVDQLELIRRKLQNSHPDTASSEGQRSPYRTPYFRRRGTLGSIEDAHDDILHSLSAALEKLSKRDERLSGTKSVQATEPIAVDSPPSVPVREHEGEEGRTGQDIGPRGQPSGNPDESYYLQMRMEQQRRRQFLMAQYQSDEFKVGGMPDQTSNHEQVVRGAR